MRKLILIFMLLLFIPIVLAITNLDFRLDVEEKGFYPNEKIPLNVTVINRDMTFAAGDAELTVNIGKRFYTFDLGDLEPGETFQKEIMLPEFPAGTHSIKGEINYTGLLDERFVEVSYGSFEVLFPPIERYPRNVYVSAYNLPEKIIGGKSYDVSITITNDGEVSADLLIEFGSIDEFFTEKATLNLGESKTVKMTVKFDNPGVSLIEARVYAVIKGDKYLLNYRGKKTYVQAERKAKLSFHRIEFVGEADNAINQEDTVKFKVFIKNDGDTATDVKGELSSSVEKVNILDSSVSYITIANKDSIAPSEDTFEIETKGAIIGDYNLNLKLSYIDSENREKEIKVPINIREGGDTCTKDIDCSDTQICKNSKCVEVPCECGYVENRKCIHYECCSDADCEEDFVCDQELHVCAVPTELTRDVLIITVGSKLDKTDMYYSALDEYRTTIKDEGLSSFYLELDSPKVKRFFSVELGNPSDWRNIKSVLDKILSKTKSKYVLILGGDGVIPQPLAKTEAEIPTIPVSDDRYADIDLDGLPDIAIGRIPIPENTRSITIIKKALESAIKMHSKSSLSKVMLTDICLFTPSCGGINDVNQLSNAIFGVDCSETRYCFPAPPYCEVSKCSQRNEFFNQLLNNDFINLNAHSSPYSFSAKTNSGWYGVLTSSKLYKKPFNTNPIFSTIGCHSGTIDHGENKNANVFAFLANGASVFVGNTRYGWGGQITSGLLSEYYFNLKKGQTSGEAIMNMKRNALKNSHSEFYNAAIYEIQLYGDPTLKINLG